MSSVTETVWTLERGGRSGYRGVHVRMVCRDMMWTGWNWLRISELRGDDVSWKFSNSRIIYLNSWMTLRQLEDPVPSRLYVDACRRWKTVERVPKTMYVLYVGPDVDVSENSVALVLCVRCSEWLHHSFLKTGIFQIYNCVQFQGVLSSGANYFPVTWSHWSFFFYIRKRVGIWDHHTGCWYGVMPLEATQTTYRLFLFSL